MELASTVGGVMFWFRGRDDLKWHRIDLGQRHTNLWEVSLCGQHNNHLIPQYMHDPPERDRCRTCHRLDALSEVSDES
jgi:hypothetical protein